MARVVFDMNECDQQLQIEDGIRRTLETAAVASIPRTAIETCYELEDESGATIDGSVEMKCGQIAKRGNLTFFLNEELAIFRREKGK